MTLLVISEQLREWKGLPGGGGGVVMIGLRTEVPNAKRPRLNVAFLTSSER